MTSDDRTRDPSRSGPQNQGGLPDDAGNGMAERSGWYDESGSGETDTPTATGDPAGTRQTPASGALSDTGTTFGTGGDDQGL